MSRCEDCGRPREECQDPEFVGYPQRSVCYATMQQKAADARYDEIHESQPFHDGSFERWSKERSKGYPFHARDGVFIWLADTDETPDDDFLDQSGPGPGGAGA